MKFGKRIARALGFGGHGSAASATDKLREPLTQSDSSQATELTGGKAAAAPHAPRSPGAVRSGSPAMKASLQQLRTEGREIANLIMQHQTLELLDGSADFDISRLSSYRAKSEELIARYKQEENTAMVTQLTAERQKLCDGLPEHLQIHLALNNGAGG